MTSPTDDRLRRSFDYAADIESIAAARADARRFVRDQLMATAAGADDEVERLIERLRLIVSELTSNAVEAAAGQWVRVEVTIEVHGAGAAMSGRRAGLTCTVTNPAADDNRPVLTVGAVPDPLAERGRGLVIVGRLADRVRADRRDGVTAVTAELDLVTDV